MQEMVSSAMVSRTILIALTCFILFLFIYINLDESPKGELFLTCNHKLPNRTDSMEFTDNNYLYMFQYPDEDGNSYSSSTSSSSINTFSESMLISDKDPSIQNCIQDASFYLSSSHSTENITGWSSEIVKHCLGVCAQECKVPNDSQLVEQLIIDQDHIEINELYTNHLSFVNHGGIFQPEDCSTNQHVAIIIPFRNREKHLPVLLRYLFPLLLKRNNIHARVFVVEQMDRHPFNRGKIKNAGYLEAMKFFPYNCLIFHDVDLIMESHRIPYDCTHSPMHLSVRIDKFNYTLPYLRLFGGVQVLSTEHFQRINGMPNTFWSWGGEDDNLFYRTARRRLRLHRPTPDTFARFTMIKHGHHTSDQVENWNLTNRNYNRARRLIHRDGLNNLLYKLIAIQSHPLYTHIKVDLQRENDYLRT